MNALARFTEVRGKPIRWKLSAKGEEWVKTTAGEETKTEVTE